MNPEPDLSTYTGPVWAKLDDGDIRRAQLMRVRGKVLFCSALINNIMESKDDIAEEHKGEQWYVLEWWPRETWWGQMKQALFGQDADWPARITCGVVASLLTSVVCAILHIFR